MFVTGPIPLYYSIVAAGHCVIACNMHSCGRGYSSTCTSPAAGSGGFYYTVGYLCMQSANMLSLRRGFCTFNSASLSKYAWYSESTISYYEMDSVLILC